MSNQDGSNGEQQPSHQAIDNGNPTILKPIYLVLDDINIDLISFISPFVALAAIFILRFSIIKVLFSLGLVVIPLRLFFPRPSIPQGIVLITGASSGIGAELSYIFASHKHDLVLVGRNKEQLEAVKNNVQQKYGSKSHIFISDLSVPGAAKELYNNVKRQNLTIDVLVNGAGLGGAGEVFEQSEEFAERMTTLNCTSLVQLTQLFGRDMVSRGRGWLLHISSVGGWMASPHQNIYHATKHYVRAFSEALSVELRAYPGIVNTQLMPGPTLTQFITRAHAEELFMMAASGAVEDPKAVALAGYNGLCKRKRMVFSSWNAAMTALLMQIAPRSVHLTVASLMNSPLRGLARSSEPEKDQKHRGAQLS